MPNPVYTAPPNTGTAILGRTLPSLLYEASERFTNPTALNHPAGGGWFSLSLDAYRTQSEEMAAGLAEHGVETGERVALFMESDVHFCVADMGCLIGGYVDVPIYLTHSPEAISYVIDHAEARVVCVSSPAHLESLLPLLPELGRVELVAVAEGDASGHRGALPERITLLTFDQLRAQGRQRLDREPPFVEDCLARLAPSDLATIIYTSGTTGQPKGVMLTHENISANALSGMSGIRAYQAGGAEETGLSFLPLTHIFARSLHYGYVAYGSSIYFVDPENLSAALTEVRPTFFATVPRLLEKVYGRIRERAATLSGVKRKLLQWALDLASAYDVTRPPAGLSRLKYAVADRLVFSKWRAALGGRIKYIISGGAALSGDLVNIFGAAGVHILQGYGLTETSPIITYNRPEDNRPGTVGVPIPGVEATLADDGEILTRGHNVMIGYYKDEARTAEVIDEQGWFHTGDIGEFSADGFLRITDRKKDLFKLSTGKYVTPQPLENRLTTEPLVEQAVVVGSGYKYCTALIFPNRDLVRVFARTKGLDAEQPLAALLAEPRVVARYQELVDAANRGMPPWSTIKHFTLVPEELSIENGLLTPTLKVKRKQVQDAFHAQIQDLYDRVEHDRLASGASGADRSETVEA